MREGDFFVWVLEGEQNEMRVLEIIFCPVDDVFEVKAICTAGKFEGSKQTFSEKKFKKIFNTGNAFFIKKK